MWQLLRDTAPVDERELLLAAADALARGDLDAIADLTHPEIVFHPIRAAVTGDYYGHAGIEKFVADNAETFDVFEISYEEFELLDDGRLYAAGTARIRGRGGHVDTKVVTAGIATFKDGLIAGWHDYGDRAAALEAAGRR
jgi:ketosteroid isomerase-like protein